MGSVLSICLCNPKKRFMFISDKFRLILHYRHFILLMSIVDSSFPQVIVLFVCYTGVNLHIQTHKSILKAISKLFKNTHSIKYYVIMNHFNCRALPVPPLKLNSVDLFPLMKLNYYYSIVNIIATADKFKIPTG